MPCRRDIGIEIVQGTICKDRSRARVTIGYPETIPVGRPSLIYVKVEWNLSEAGRMLRLELRRRSEAGGDDIRFGGPDGEHILEIEGDAERLVAIFGKTARAGAELNTHLNIQLDEDEYGVDPPIEIVPLAAETVPTGDAAQAILQREVVIALHGARPSEAAEQGIWDRWNVIYEDARALADALETAAIGQAEVPPLRDGENQERRDLDRAEIAAHLRSGRDPAGLANAKAQGRTDGFDPYQGQWRGLWRQRQDAFCNRHLDTCRDQQGGETLRTAPDSALWSQSAVSGPDSRPYMTASEDGQPLDCLGLAPGRDVDIPAVSAIDIGTGLIAGATGVQAQAGDDGVQSLSPRIGFYVDHGKLLWMTETGRDGDLVSYGIHYDLSLDQDAGAVDNQRRILIGLDLRWHRTEHRIDGAIGIWAKQYLRILTPEAQQLEQDFRARRLRQEHIGIARYRRRLELSSPAMIEEFLAQAEGAGVSDYLERLRDFQTLRTMPPLEGRESITFIMGDLEAPNARNQFYRSATNHFTLHPKGDLIPDLRTLSEVRDYLANHPPANRLPWGEINIVVHANEEGGMTIPVRPLQPGEDPDTHVATPENLEAAMTSGDLAPLPDNLVDARTVLRIRGCALGRSPEMLDTLSTAFGGEGQQRPIIRAPKHLQAYDFTTQGEQVTVSDEFLIEFWFISYPKGQAPNNAQLVTQFEEQFPDVEVDWATGLARPDADSDQQPASATRERTYSYSVSTEYSGLPANDAELEALVIASGGSLGNAANVHETGRTDQGDGTFEIEFNFQSNGSPSSGSIEVGISKPGNDVERIALFAVDDDLVTDLGRIGYGVNDYSWDFEETDVSIAGAQRLWTLTGLGSRMIRRVERELREPDPAHPGATRRQHPPVTDETHYGSEIPIPGAEAPLDLQPLGENILP